MNTKDSVSELNDIRIFLVDDEDLLAWGIETELKTMGAEVLRAASVQQSLARFPGFGADVAIVDLNLPDGNGLELLKKWRRDVPSMPIILITANPAIDSAITAVKLGAFDYLQKPFAMKDLQVAVKRAVEVSKLRQKVRQFEGREKHREPLTIVGSSELMSKVNHAIKRIAVSKVDTVLVYGETGCGKELVARALHEWSPRTNEPFVEINCASIPENLLESELFGYEKGAFTDARERKLGLFEVARNGTIFLDEIGELPMKLQAKLLRVLEYRRFKRLGGTKDIEFGGRIVAATNRKLDVEIAEGRFRPDLYYRLNVIDIPLPPLRERKGDIPQLTEFLLGQICMQFGVQKPVVSSDCMARLIEYDWPGNVRELRNALQRSVILFEPRQLEAMHLRLKSIRPRPVLCAMQDTGVSENEFGPEAGEPASDSLPHPNVSSDPAALFRLPQTGISLEDLERSLLVQALEQSRQNQTKAANLLGITRHTFRYRLEKFGLLDQVQH